MYIPSLCELPQLHNHRRKLQCTTCQTPPPAYTCSELHTAHRSPPLDAATVIITKLIARVSIRDKYNYKLFAVVCLYLHYLKLLVLLAIANFQLCVLETNTFEYNYAKFAYAPLSVVREFWIAILQSLQLLHCHHPHLSHPLPHHLFLHHTCQLPGDFSAANQTQLSLTNGQGQSQRRQSEL